MTKMIARNSTSSSSSNRRGLGNNEIQEYDVDRAILLSPVVTMTLPERAPPNIHPSTMPSSGTFQDDDGDCEDLIKSPKSVTMFLDTSFTYSFDSNYDRLESSSSSPSVPPIIGIRLRPRTFSDDSSFSGISETTGYVPMSSSSHLRALSFARGTIVGDSGGDTTVHESRACDNARWANFDASFIDNILIPEI